MYVCVCVCVCECVCVRVCVCVRARETNICNVSNSFFEYTCMICIYWIHASISKFAYILVLVFACHHREKK